MTAELGIIAAGLALGFAGSGHCGVMCGPLVLLTHPREATPRGIAGHVASYHAGRLVMYASLGLVLGLTGGAFVSGGFGRALAVAAAIVLVAQALWHRRLKSSGAWPAAMTRAIGAAGRWMRVHPALGPAAFGALTGLLPCGLIYAALTAAAGLGDAADGAMFMLAFGLGSVPLLAAIGVSADRLRLAAPQRFLRQAAPVGLVIVAALLMLRASGVHAEHAPVSHARADVAAPHAHHH